MPVRKIPLRKCTGCGEMKPKKELVRIVRAPDGSVSADLTGRAAGRGAYLCNNPACLKLAKKAKRLERSLDCKIPDSVYEDIEKSLAVRSEHDGQN